MLFLLNPNAAQRGKCTHKELARGPASAGSTVTVMDIPGGGNARPAAGLVMTLCWPQYRQRTVFSNRAVTTQLARRISDFFGVIFSPPDTHVSVFPFILPLRHCAATYL